MTAVSKVTLNGTTLMDATTATASANEIISPYTAMTADGVMTTGTASGGGESYETEFLELKNIIEGNVTEIDNSTITKWVAGLLYQNRNITKHVWREMSASGNNQFLRGATAMTLCVFPKMISTGSDMFWNCTNLAVADFGALRSNYGLEAYTFENCPALTTLILRPNHVCKLNNTNAFNGTPFANGGAGGEIYVPSAQIENYKIATNWSTVDGYGTITWKAIEGSQYENYYADGSEVSA